jgi:phosphoribosylamine--glycine ligase
MKILLLGSGAREHALAMALRASPLTEALHCAPGNAGIASLATLHGVDITDAEGVTALAEALSADLVVIGPEAPLVAGVADALRKKEFAVFGPGAAGARLEGSKVFAKRFMERHGIPTAPFAVCTTLDEAKKALAARRAPFVVKADGLAAGKGAFLPDSAGEAERICRALLEERVLGDAGAQIVVEDHLPGWEVTVLAVTDGKTIRILPLSQDHKRACDGDRGPNTGGMGAYTPVPQATPALLEKIRTQVLEPTVRGLAEEGIPFCGVLYAGIMVVQGNPLLLEYNVRFGDPEAQVVLPALRVDWAKVFAACCRGELHRIAWPGEQKAAVGVVLASGGYPDAYTKGYPISGIDAAEREGVTVFHAGTVFGNAGVETAGGRVLTVVGVAESLREARQRAYAGVEKIFFKDVHFRRDIASKALSAPLVGIVLGSASDAPLAKEIAKTFDELHIDYEVTVSSAHRTPDAVAAYARNAAPRGLKAIIAVAGLSAALPGVLAAHTALPVVGVPVASGTLGGMDALLAVAQMPPGVPVASMGINGGRNAALFTVRILALQDRDTATRLDAWIAEAARGVAFSREKLAPLPLAPEAAFSSDGEDA